MHSVSHILEIMLSLQTQNGLSSCIFPMPLLALIGDVCSRKFNPRSLRYHPGWRAVMGPIFYSILTSTPSLIAVASRKAIHLARLLALTLHPIVETIKHEVPNMLVDSWYLDDGTLVGTLMTCYMH